MLKWLFLFQSNYQEWTRDLLSRDRDETRDPCLRDETKTFKILSETETRRCSFRDTGRDLEASETLESLASFNVSPKRSPWLMGKHINNEKKLYGLINSHHGKCFLFVILWVFALYFDNCHWIINSLHHKDYCNCTAVDMSHYVYRNLQATEISQLQLIIALYVN